MDGESPHPARGRVKRIGIRSPNVLHDTLARYGAAFCRIRTPSICQVKAFDARPSYGAAGRFTEVVIDHQHAVVHPTERLGTGNEAILEAGRLLMIQHLLWTRLAHIDDREAVVMPGLELVGSPKRVS